MEVPAKYDNSVKSFAVSSTITISHPPSELCMPLMLSKLPNALAPFERTSDHAKRMRRLHGPKIRHPANHSCLPFTATGTVDLTTGLYERRNSIRERQISNEAPTAPQGAGNDYYAILYEKSDSWPITNKYDPHEPVQRVEDPSLWLDTSKIVEWRSIISLITNTLASRVILLAALAMFISPAAAMDLDHGHQDPTLNTALPQIHTATWCVGLTWLIGERVRNIVQPLPAPIMGASSILFVMFRNDDAIDPWLSWSVFGVWFIATMAYLRAQANRLVYFNLYVITSAVLTGLCMCIVALVQKGSLQRGVVTAIPVCVAFSVFALTLPFRERRVYRDDSA